MLFALTVVLTHIGPVSGMWGDLGRTDNNVGTLAVEGFFVLSGFLVTRSAMSSRSLESFMVRRISRIFPGFWVALLLTAFVFAPLVGHPDMYSQSWYVRNNWWLAIYQDGVQGTLEHVPYLYNWNVSLWTLKWEFGCYAFVGLLLAFKCLRASFVVLLTVFAWVWLNGTPHFDDRPGRFFILFMLGSALWVLRDRVPIRRGVVITLALLASATYATVGFREVGLIAYGALVVAIATAPVLTRIGHRVDLSYGVYLYGWPVGQVLTSASVSSPVIFVAAELAGCLTLALASWYLIEAPAQRWSHHVSRRRSRDLSSSLSSHDLTPDVAS